MNLLRKREHKPQAPSDVACLIGGFFCPSHQARERRNENPCPNSLTASTLIFVASRLRHSLTRSDRKNRQLRRLGPIGRSKTHTEIEESDDISSVVVQSTGLN